MLVYCFISNTFEIQPAMCYFLWKCSFRMEMNSHCSYKFPMHMFAHAVFAPRNYSNNYHVFDHCSSFVLLKSTRKLSILTRSASSCRIANPHEVPLPQHRPNDFRSHWLRSRRGRIVRLRAPANGTPPLKPWKTRKAHAHTHKLLYQRDASGEDGNQKTHSCV